MYYRMGLYRVYVFRSPLEANGIQLGASTKSVRSHEKDERNITYNSTQGGLVLFRRTLCCFECFTQPWVKLKLVCIWLERYRSVFWGRGNSTYLLLAIWFKRDSTTEH